MHQVEKDVSLYLLTVTMTNAGLGVAVGMAMYGLGMPNPVLWGVMVGCFNFIPYLGDYRKYDRLDAGGLGHV